MSTVEYLLNNEEDVEEEDLALLADDVQVQEENSNENVVELVQADENAENDTQGGTGEDANATVSKPKKIRKPRPKLNVDTLRGKRGLHTLPKVFEKVKFKGPGHEEHDLMLLMKNYEYWCHRLFHILPFDDCLEKLETLGHKKPVQVLIKRIRLDMPIEDVPTIQSDPEDVDDDVRNPGSSTQDLHSNDLGGDDLDE